MKFKICQQQHRRIFEKKNLLLFENFITLFFWLSALNLNWIQCTIRNSSQSSLVLIELSCKTGLVVIFNILKIIKLLHIKWPSFVTGFKQLLLCSPNFNPTAANKLFQLVAQKCKTKTSGDNRSILVEYNQHIQKEKITNKFWQFL